MDASDWQPAVEEVARRLITRAGLLSPPVDALQIAERLGITVVIDQAQPTRARTKRLQGRPMIFLKPDERQERMQWAAAHELGEVHIPELCQAAGISPEALNPRQREEFANRLAGCLLLPMDWFRPSASLGLLALKQQFTTASHELIALRWLDLDQAAVVTIIDQGQVTRRSANRPLPNKQLLSVERDCLAELRAHRQPATTQDGPWRVAGWPVDTAEWQREILYAQFHGEEGAAD